MNRQKLLERIRRCLALARSANEHEAAAALAKARELMDANGVEDGEIAALEIEEATAKRHASQRPPRWETCLAQAVTRAIPVAQLIHGADRRFIGPSPGPEIAAYAFTALARQLRRARRDYVAKHLKKVRTSARKAQRADAYCEGWALAVHSTIAALYPKRAPHQATDNYLARRFGDQLSTATSRASSGSRTDRDLWKGFDAGCDARLHQGVSAAATRGLLA